MAGAGANKFGDEGNELRRQVPPQLGRAKGRCRKWELALLAHHDTRLRQGSPVALKRVAQPSGDLHDVTVMVVMKYLRPRAAANKQAPRQSGLG
jgi:hypothetical protein